MPQWLLGKIKDRDTGLSTVNILDIFDHAFDCRGQIDDDLVDEYSSRRNAMILHSWQPKDSCMWDKLGCSKENTSCGREGTLP
eukprot:6586985-Ditylum_brightwellii.AAC.1